MNGEVSEFVANLLESPGGLNVAVGRGVATTGRWLYFHDGISCSSRHGARRMPTLNELNPETWSRQHFGTCELGDVRRTRRLVRYAQQMAEKPDASTPQQTECWSDCKAVYELFRRTEVTFNAVTAAHNRHTLSLPAGKYLATRVHRVASRKRVTESEVWGRVIDRVKSSSRDVQFVHVCDRGADNFDVFAPPHIKGDSWVIRAAQLTRKLHTSDQRCSGSGTQTSQRL